MILREAAAGAAAGAAGAAGGFETLLVTLVAVIAATKLLGELAQRAGQPAVLGELVAGVVLGGSALRLLDPQDPVIHAFSELGVILLLFEIGLHTDLASLTRVGTAASTVGLVGVVLPFAGGYALMQAMDYGQVPSLVGGAALTATSIGISARVLSDLGRLGTPEGQVTLGAAVLDDIVGLIILAVIAGVVAGGHVDVWGVARTGAVAVGFVVTALLVGGVLIRPYLRAIARIRLTGALGLLAMAVAFGLAWMAARSGSAMIVGAFAAGVILHPTRQRDEIQAFSTNLGHFFVPIFFASVGAAVDLRALADPKALALGAGLVLVGVAGKVAAGFAPWWFRGDKLLVGVAMVPRGEVGLIFAQMGLASGAIAGGEFGAIMLMVLATTFVTPPLLGLLARRRPLDADTLAQPGDGGIDDLVAGER
ncbi:MAG: cation:proton antiporter [Gemmatimonadota bacterium]|nr:cation:proton antiporter [Gemmatimonadota bacterium]